MPMFVSPNSLFRRFPNEFQLADSIAPEALR
jgi:hypothetical protein